MDKTLRYTYRIRPGRSALLSLDRDWNTSRWVWNQCVDADRSHREGVLLSYGQMAARLTDWRGQHDWLREGSVVVQQQAVRTWDGACVESVRHTSLLGGNVQLEHGTPRYLSAKGIKMAPGNLAQLVGG